MVFVFGIDLPLIEVLAILTLIILISIIFILIELRKLRKLLSEESMDINRFERDLYELEKSEGKLNEIAIKEYINNSVRRGIDKNQIKNTMLKRGWDEKRVNKLLN
jgi:hypothetical protein